MRLGAEDERVAVNGRACHEAGGELVFSEFLEMRAGLDDGGFAFLAEKVNASIGGDGGSGIVASNIAHSNFPHQFWPRHTWQVRLGHQSCKCDP